MTPPTFILEEELIQYKCNLIQFLTLIRVGFLGVRFEVGGVKLPHLKLVRIILEGSNLVSKYTPICSFRKYTFQCLGPLNFANINIFQQKNSIFYPRKYLYSKQQCESCLRDFLVLFSVFVRQKVTVTENITFATFCVRNPASGLLQIGQKSEK